jgi:general secretion pathway protein H
MEANNAGFTLLEAVCVIAIIALLAAFAWPAMPRYTSRPTLEMFALRTAALLIEDRDAAIRRQARVTTSLDSRLGVIHSGSSGNFIQLPSDVQFKAVIAEECNWRLAGRHIIFFSSGMSCGGTIFLSRPGITYEIGVNWLTGGVKVD